MADTDATKKPLPRYVELKVDRNRGPSWSTTTDAPTLPEKIDAKATSLLVGATPVAFFEQPNFKGAALVITRGGECADLATCVPSAGNWRNRIRSVKFPPANDPLLKDGIALQE